jgi:hypothetical protein
VIVARNNDEAERIARGEDVMQRREETEEEAAALAAETFFEPEARRAQEGEGEEQPAESGAPAQS